LYWECGAGAQIIFSESGHGVGHVSSTIFGNSDSLASCLKYKLAFTIVWQIMNSLFQGVHPEIPGEIWVELFI